MFCYNKTTKRPSFSELDLKLLLSVSFIFWSFNESKENKYKHDDLSNRMAYLDAQVSEENQTLAE